LYQDTTLVVALDHSLRLFLAGFSRRQMRCGLKPGKKIWTLIGTTLIVPKRVVV